MNRKKGVIMDSIKRLLIPALAAFALQASAQNIRGTWSGKLDAGMMKLALVLHVDNDSTCRLDSPDQGAKDIAGRVAYISADSILVKMPKLVALYGARLVDGELRGTFVQGLTALPLTLKQGTLVRHRPQTPQPPYPYQTEEVTFVNEQAGATLAGTLTQPKGTTTVLLMVTGSGQQNRDEELFGHKPFAVIADRLARQGIATLRYDDRGTGLSKGGEVKNATTKDFADDALAGIEWLRKSGRFEKVGILGHSEGGVIAFMLGAQRKADFIISLAGPAVKGDSLLLEQNKALLGDAAKNLTLEAVRSNVAALHKPWYDYFIGYDPQPDIARISCPIMALNGGKDRQVVASQNLSALRRWLPKNVSNVLKVYPDLNHLFQHCQTGLPAEYGEIEETISEEVLQDIVKWMNNLKL